MLISQRIEHGLPQDFSIEDPDMEEDHQAGEFIAPKSKHSLNLNSNFFQVWRSDSVALAIPQSSISNRERIQDHDKYHTITQPLHCLVIFSSISLSIQTIWSFFFNPRLFFLKPISISIDAVVTVHLRVPNYNYNNYKSKQFKPKYTSKLISFMLNILAEQICIRWVHFRELLFRNIVLTRLDVVKVKLNRRNIVIFQINSGFSIHLT